MTKYSNYDVHKSYDVGLFANSSSMFWPTLNCSTPKTLSTVTALMMNLVSLPTTNIDARQRVICDEFEIIHDGAVDLRVSVDNEPLANESVGKIIKPGEIWTPPFRLHKYLVFYTSSNASQLIRLSVGGYV